MLIEIAHKDGREAIECVTAMEEAQNQTTDRWISHETRHLSQWG